MLSRQELPDLEQRRLLRIIGYMPLASASNLATIVQMSADSVRRRLNGLRRAGWVSALKRGVTEPRQNRWFLSSRSVELLYSAEHLHPTPRELAIASGESTLGLGRQPPPEFRQRFALDHDHPLHLEGHAGSPFVGDDIVAQGHEHPPWTATSRGVWSCMRRQAMLERVYRLAPDLLLSGRVRRNSRTTSRQLRMTYFRLMRHGGFYHAVARYGQDVWVPFIYVGLHATERVLRRKERHRFWGVDCYSSREDGYLRIANRSFYEDPGQEIEPSAQVVVAVDAWACELARRTLTDITPTVFCTPDGRCAPVVELRPSLDLVCDPSGHPAPGEPEMAEVWLRQNPDVAVIDSMLAHRLFMTICQFPAMRASWLGEVAGGSASEVARHLGRLVDTGLAAVFDQRYYLAELGMRRAANMSRMMPAVIRSRHGAYMDRWYREHERSHNDGVNLLAALFAREGVEVVAGWRGEVNVPGFTQVRPDLLVQVNRGPFGAGTHCIEYERSAIAPSDVHHKLRTYRRMAAAGRTLPLLVVCETERGRANFQTVGSDLPVLTSTMERALAGPLTGPVTAWTRNDVPAALHCRF